MYHLLGVCLALAALLAINGLASLLAATIWRGLTRPARGWSAATRARLIFALRAFPAAGAFICVAALLIPAYLAYEPRTTTETVSTKLAILALLSTAGIMLALWRGFGAWRATRLLVNDWLRHGEPISLEGVSIPAYRIRHPFPVIAVIGTIRPRLFVANRVLDSLSREELSAALAHERAHLAVRDNLKRGWLRACRDVLALVPCGRSLDCAWGEASEAAADEHAARAGGAAVALDLAAALVKIARIAPAGAKPTMPAGAFLIGETLGGVAQRVHRLTQLAGTNAGRQGRGDMIFSLFMWSGCGGFVIAVGLAAIDTQVLALMHDAIEHIVSALR